jgi:hypothetical protein
MGFFKREREPVDFKDKGSGDEKMDSKVKYRTIPRVAWDYCRYSLKGLGHEMNSFYEGLCSGAADFKNFVLPCC